MPAADPTAAAREVVRLAHALPRIPPHARHLGAAALRSLLGQHLASGELRPLAHIVASNAAREALFAELPSLRKHVAGLAEGTACCEQQAKEIAAALVGALATAYAAKAEEAV